MGFLDCRKPAWEGDDFSTCITVDLLTVLLPAVVGGISGTWLLGSAAHGVVKRRFRKRYQRIPTADNNDAISNNDGDETEDDDDEFAEHLSLRHTISRTGDVEVKVDRPKAESVAVALELLCVMGTLATFLPALLMGESEGEIWRAAVAALPWVYTLGLVLARFFKSRGGPGESSSLWDHTALIYMMNFFFVCIPFRSAIIHPLSEVLRNADIARFVFISILCIVTISVRKGNTVVVQAISDGLEPSKEPLASLWSLASFSWIDRLIWNGFWKPLDLQDIWNLRNDDLAVTVLMNYRQTKKTANLAWSLLKHFKRDLIIQSLWAAFGALFVFAPTLLLRVILEYIAAPDKMPRNVAWLFVALMLVTGTIVAVGNGQSLFIGRRICIRLRAVIIGEVYAKALRRKAAGGLEKALGEKKKFDKKGVEIDDGQTNVGAIINLMAVDSFKVSEVCAYLHFLVAAAPVQLIVAIVLLYQVLGWSCIAGVGVMLLLMPVNYYISSQFSAIQKMIMTRTDKRIHTTNEVLQNIRIIKYFAWEERFGHVVNDARTAELKQLWRRYVLWALAATSWYGSPMLITFLSFLCYTVIEKKDLNAPVAFTALSLFNVLRVPLDQLADMITNVLQTKVSVDRVEEFLREEETEKFYQLKHVEPIADAPLIGFKNATLSWGSRQDALAGGTKAGFQLQDLDITFTPGKLNVVAGATGSGKTSLLMGLLGEMTHLKGSVHLPGIHSREELRPDPATGLIQGVAYCAQQPWLVNDTIKQNILFSSPYDDERYKAVLAACSLERDLSILDHGDETEVGEKGISLSGGQKQRISLARALYSNAAHLLLDDCLSAVDSHTAKWIHEFCITGPLMEGRTCILVTHNVALCVPSAEKVIVLDNGRVIQQGDAETVVKSGALGADELLKTGMSRQNSQRPSRVPSYVGEELVALNGDASHGLANGDAAVKKTKASKDEVKTEGGVSWKVYQLYLSSMGPWWYWIIVIAIFLAQQFGSVATTVWIREWATKYGTPEEAVVMAEAPMSFTFNIGCHNSGSCLWGLPMSFPSDNNTLNVAQNPKVDVWYYLGIYALLGLSYMALSFSREIVVFYGSFKASKDIHRILMENIMRAKLKFFDQTPLGRIMNRFSKDMEAIDQEVAPVALGMIHSLGAVIAIVVLITVITPAFFLAGIIIAILYCIMGAFYLRASRDLKRIESIQRSPLYQHFGETLNGVSTIRAYGDERRFVRENLAKIDAHNRPFFYLWACNRWLGFRVDIAGAFVSFFAGVFVVLSVGKIDAGLAGLSLTYAITFNENVLWVVRLYALNEQNMNSVERVREYLEVEQEAPEIIPTSRPAMSWPEHGAVSFKNYSTRYREDLDLVLKNVTFDITAGQKVGIVGRTGAGKSSLTLALFRSLEAESGSIIIDDIDISTIGLRDLRQSITMVPQDPTLFTGTIRSNLDPFGIHTDAEIFDSLKRVQLISSTPDPTTTTTTDDSTANKNIFTNLLSPVSESGNNLSQGQRQLVCLARALLRSPKVFIMDEATGSLDYETDTKIQETVSQMSSTIITIAHRLKSVAAYNRIVVLDQGRVVEFAHPHELLKDRQGVFYAMCESSGELETLREMAREAYRKEFVLVETDGE